MPPERSLLLTLKDDTAGIVLPSKTLGMARNPVRRRFVAATGEANLEKTASGATRERAGRLCPSRGALLWAAALFGLCFSSYAQDAAGRALGVVTKIDADARQLTVKPDQGAEVSVSLDARASFRKVAPGETNLANATNIAITDVHPGDRVLARGKAGDTPNSVTATLIVVMSQSDIQNRQAAERADWDKRGVTGVVTEAAADHVTINVRTLAGVQPLTIMAGTNAVIRRYAPDSVKFADAKPSTLADVRKGDQVRARGDKSADGMKMTADEIVSGSFRMIAAQVVSVDPAENIVRINNLETKKQMAVRISMDSTVKKLQPQLAMIIAARLHGVSDAAAGGRGPLLGPGGQPVPNEGRGGFGGRGAEVPPGGAPGGGGGFAGRGGAGGAGRGDLQAMIDRMPTMMLADLKMGDAIIVSSTVGASADQVTAITLLAGVEPILTKPGTREMSLGDWNVGGDLGGIGGFGQ